jgi:hypothetical protein
MAASGSAAALPLSWWRGRRRGGRGGSNAPLVLAAATAAGSSKGRPRLATWRQQRAMAASGSAAALPLSWWRGPRRGGCGGSNAPLVLAAATAAGSSKGDGNSLRPGRAIQKTQPDGHKGHEARQRGPAADTPPSWGATTCSPRRVAAALAGRDGPDTPSSFEGPRRALLFSTATAFAQGAPSKKHSRTATRPRGQAARTRSRHPSLVGMPPLLSAMAQRRGASSPVVVAAAPTGHVGPAARRALPHRGDAAPADHEGPAARRALPHRVADAPDGHVGPAARRALPIVWPPPSAGRDGPDAPSSFEGPGRALLFRQQQRALPVMWPPPSLAGMARTRPPRSKAQGAPSSFR